MKEIRFALSLMTPGVWLALLLAALAVFGLGGAIGYRVASGMGENAVLKVENERASERTQHAQQLAAEVAKVVATERQWGTRLGDVAAIHKQEMDDAKTKIDALRADVRAGSTRLSIAVKAAAATAGSCPASGNPAPAGGAVEETRAELVPSAADALISIAADGDDAVRDFNACHDAYEALRQRVTP